MSASGPTRLRNARRGRPSSRVAGRTDQGLALLRQAEFWVDATRSPVSGGKLVNLGSGGSALDAQFGSTTGTDTNDPTLLPHTGTNYLYLPGVAGNSASTPDAPALDITGDLEIVVRVALDDWTPAALQTFVAKRDASASYVFRITALGRPELVWWTASLVSFATVTTAVPFADGTAYWLKATFDVNNGAGGNDFKVYYAADQPTEPTSWTQLGSTVTTAGVTSIDAGTAPLYVGAGSAGTADPAVGRFYRAIVRNGIGGTTVFDADFTTGITTGGQTTFTASTGQTVTINSATSGRKAVAVTRPVVLLGADDYFEVADNALLNFGASQDFTVLAVARRWATTTAAAHIVSKSGTAGGGVGSPIWRLGNDGTTTLTHRGVIGDTTGANAIVAAATATAGALVLMAFTVNRTSQLMTPYLNGTAGSTASTATVGDLTNTRVMRIGNPTDTLDKPLDGEFIAAAVFRRALTAAEISAIVSYYGAA